MVILVIAVEKIHDFDTDAVENIRQFLRNELSENCLLVLSLCENIPSKRFKTLYERIKFIQKNC